MKPFVAAASMSDTERCDVGPSLSASPPPVPSNAYVYMDSMRAVFAMGVALSHVWTLMIGDYVRTDNLLINGLYFAAGFGHSGVVLFFVLSGYWIARSVVRRLEEETWSWPGYLADRLSRLLVVIVPVLLLGGTLDYVAAHWLESTTIHNLTGSYLLRVPHERSLSLTTLLGNLAFLQGLAVPPFGSNGPLWSLAYEFWYYLWLPALCLLIRGRPSFVLAALLLGIIYPDLALGFLTWCCGVLLFFAERALRKRPLLRHWCERHLLTIALLPFGAMLLWLRATGDRWLDGAVAFTFAALLLGLIVANPIPFRGIRSLAQYGAQASFSLYATHFPLAVFAATLLVDRIRPQPALGSVSLAAAILAGCVTVAWFFAKLTEARTDTIRSALSRSRMMRDHPI